MGSNTPDQEKKTKSVKTTWNEKNAFSTNMEAKITAPPHEILRDQATARDGPYFAVHKSLEATKKNRYFYIFSLFLLYSCFVFEGLQYIFGYK